MSFAEVGGDFLSDNYSPDRWGDYHRGRIFSELLCQQTAYARGDRGILQEERALEKLSTMQPGAKDEVPTDQGSCAVEEIEDFIHGKECQAALARQTFGIGVNRLSDLQGIR